MVLNKGENMFPRIVYYITDSNNPNNQDTILSKEEYEQIFDSGKMSDTYDEYLEKESMRIKTNSKYTICNTVVNNEQELLELSQKYKLVNE